MLETFEGKEVDIQAPSYALFNNFSDLTLFKERSELEELRSVCDRVAIVDEGKIAGILPASTPAEEFGMLMMGERIKTSSSVTE